MASLYNQTEIQCKSPGTVKRAIRTGMGPYAINSTLTYKCDGELHTHDGYNVKVITCTSSGTWSDVNIDCKGTAIPSHYYLI